MLVSDRDGWQDGEIFLLERVAAEITAPTTNEVRFLPLCGPLMFGQQPFPAIRAFGVRSPTHDELAGDVADKLVAQTIAALGQDSMPSDLWMPRDSEAWARVKPMIEAKCSWLGQRASAIAPPFVTRNRQIEALWLHPEDFDYTVGSIPFGEVEARETRWTVTRPPTPVVLALRDQTGELFRVDQAGSDTEAWAVFALSRALFELKGDLVDRIAERDFDVPPPSSYGQRQLYVIDEPERHLHPQAQREAAQFLADLARDGADVVIATHSPAFLHVPYSDAAYLRVSRDESGTTRATEITGDLLRHLERAVESLGLTRADLIQLTRAALIVEGEHDSWILRDLYGDRLSAAFIRILKLSGAHNTLALLDAELLRSLGLPTIVLLDDTHLDNIRQLADRKLPTGRLSREERALAQLVVRWGRQPGLKLLAFPYPDIICALPENAVHRVVPSFHGWQPVIDAYRAHPPTNFKDFALDHLGWRPTSEHGAGSSAAKFIRAVLAAVSEETDLPPTPLDRLIDEILATVTA